jgi:gliding motility-associated-like protein
MFSQSINQFNLSGDIFGCRVFIENKGQFNNEIPNGDAIKYGYINGNETVFFNTNGLSYLLEKKYILTEHDREEVEHGHKLKDKPVKKYLINMAWENSNSNIEIIESEQQSWYHSYGDEKLKSKCYKKLTYKNVYNNIDIEYVFTNDKTHGLKYNIILHPGAHINDIKIKYTGDVEGIKMKNGNIFIKTPLDDIKEHVPISYQDVSVIESKFILNDGVISFDTPNGYDHTKELIIDPWVTSLATLTSNNYGYDVDYDYSGNLYVFGGITTYKIAKYAPSGILLWTFSGVVASAGWTSTSNYIYPLIGNFIVDKFSQKSYTGQGYFGSGTRIVRLDPNGLYDNYITTANNLWQECWDFGLKCSTGEILGFGGDNSGNKTGSVINQTTGAISPNSFNPTFSSPGQDVVNNAIDDNGDVFVIYSSVQTTFLDNKISKINPALNNNIWIVPSQYLTLQENENKSSYIGAGLVLGSSNGFNCITVNSNYLFYYDGFNVAAYDKSTGARLGFTTIAGQTPRTMGGIAVDDCNNVYVGANNTIKSFNFNGTNFTALPSINLNATTTNKFVYDLKLDKNTNLLYASGSGFAGVYSAVNSLTCSINQISVTSTCVTSNNGSAIGTLTTNVSSPIVSYTWTNSSSAIVSQTNNSTSLTNSVTGLPNGVYTFFSQINAPCGPVNSQTININCSCGLVLTPSVTVADADCNSLTGSLTIHSIANGTPGYTITEAASTLTTNFNLPYSVTGISVGTHTYGIISSNGCSSTFTVSIQQVLLPPNLSVASPIMLNCIQSTTLNATSTSSNVSFSWTGPNILTGAQTQTPTIDQVGNYTLTVTQGSCTNSAVVTVVSNTNIPSITITPTLATICSGQTTTLTAIGASTYTWNPSGTLNTSSGNMVIASPLSTTNYSVTGTLNTCTNSAVVTVSVLSNPTLILNPNATICQGAGASTTLTATGATSYTWANAVSLSSSTGSVVIASPNVTTNYTVTGVNAACTNTAIVTVSVNPSPTITATTVNNTSCGLSNGSATVISLPSNNTYTWSSGVSSTTNTASNLVAGNYTITINNGACQTNTVISIIGSVSLSIISSTVLPSNCNLNDGSISITDNMIGSNYSWSPNVSVTNNAAGLPTGNYALTIINGACTTSTIFNVGSIGGPLGFISITGPSCDSDDGSIVIDSIKEGVKPYSINFNNNGLTNNMIFENLSTGNYTLSIRDSSLCETEYVLTVPSNKTDFTLYIPNTFTPNNDKVNDIWLIKGTCLDKMNCLIYNRWGEKIRELRDINEGWDGTYKGVSVPDGVYIYLIEVSTKEGTINKAGHITVFR